MRRTRSFAKILCGAIALSIVSCATDGKGYSDFKELEGEEWVYGDTLTFRPEGIDSIGSADIILSLRHSSSYPYRNIWIENVFVYEASDSSLVENRDTVNLELSDLFGRWHGKGIGTSFMITDSIGHFNESTRLKEVRFRHIMRVDTLPSIEQVGIIVRARQK